GAAALGRAVGARFDGVRLAVDAHADVELAGPARRALGVWDDELEALEALLLRLEELVPPGARADEVLAARGALGDGVVGAGERAAGHFETDLGSWAGRGRGHLLRGGRRVGGLGTAADEQEQRQEHGREQGAKPQMD